MSSALRLPPVLCERCSGSVDPVVARCMGFPYLSMNNPDALSGCVLGLGRLRCPHLPCPDCEPHAIAAKAKYDLEYAKMMGEQQAEFTLKFQRALQERKSSLRPTTQ